MQPTVCPLIRLIIKSTGAQLLISFCTAGLPVHTVSWHFPGHSTISCGAARVNKSVSVTWRWYHFLHIKTHKAPQSANICQGHVQTPSASYNSTKGKQMLCNKCRRWYTPVSAIKRPCLHKINRVHAELNSQEGRVAFSVLYLINKAGFPSLTCSHDVCEHLSTKGKKRKHINGLESYHIASFSYRIKSRSQALYKVQ